MLHVFRVPLEIRLPSGTAFTTESVRVCFVCLDRNGIDGEGAAAP
jgi:hypothetical protein